MAKSTDDTDESSGGEFSVIKFFKAFEQKIAKLNVYPICIDNLTIQQDAFKRLGAEADLDNLFDNFATLEFSAKQKDEDVRFAITFSKNEFILDIEYLGTFIFNYDLTEYSEKNLADQLFALLCMLSNGQLRFWQTSYIDFNCVMETLLINKNGKAVVIETLGKFPWWIRSDADADTYEIQVKKNQFRVPKVDIPKNFIIGIKGEKVIVEQGRDVKTDNPTPLTKKTFVVVKHRAGLNLNKNITKVNSFNSGWGKLLFSWEFWALSLLFGMTWIYVDTASNKPISAIYIIFFIAIIAMSIYKIIIPLLIRKIYLQKNDPKHPYVVADNLIHKIFSSYLYSLFLAIFLGFSWAPLYNPEPQKFISTFELASLHAWILAVPMLSIISIITSVIRSKFTQFVASASVLIAIITSIIANTYSDTTVTTPEPLTSIYITLIFILVIWSLVRLVKSILPKNKKSKNTYLLTNSELKHKILNTTKHVKKINKVDRVIWFIGGITLFCSGYYFWRDLPNDSLIVGTPLIFGLGIGIFGMLYAYRAILDSTNQLLILGLFFSLLLVPLLIKDSSNGGAASAWILLFLSIFICMFSAALRIILGERLAKQKITLEIKN